ncbi:MAG TPA: hypothetical protein VMM78_09455 [Thermomicrobiales bacterium]|nr:hypothetical protein [Thermomicrobiales bacterium]
MTSTPALALSKHDDNETCHDIRADMESLMKLAAGALMCALIILLSACLGSDADPTATATSAPEAATATEQPAATPTIANPTATTAAAPTVAAPTSAPATASTPTTAAATATPGEQVSDIEVQLAGVAAIVAEIRGLEWLEDVGVTIVSRQGMQEYLLDLLEADYSAEEARQDSQLLWLLRLMNDPELDIHELYSDLLAESVAGLYDTETQEILTLGEGDGLTPLAAMIMAHEYTHALQDQHYGLDSLRPDDLDSEARFAMQALTEGDAEIVRTLYLFDHMSREDLLAIMSDPALDSEIPEDVPAYLLEINYFPYTSGAEFAAYLYQRGGFEAIDAAYADPPLSTEQILHPEKYAGPERDNPVLVELPDFGGALGEGWVEIQNDVIGEFDLRILLRENGASDFTQAAAGWGGGRYLFYTSGESGIVINGVAWDSDEDREEFDEAFLSTLEGMLESGGIYDDGAGRFHTLIQYERLSVFMASNDREALQRAISVLVG